MTTAVANDMTYREVERMLDGLCWSFVRRYGLEWEEARAEASLAYARAYASYDPTRAAFTTWCWWAVRNALCDMLRQQGKHGREFTNSVACDEDGCEVPLVEAAEARPPSMLSAVLAELGGDARAVAEIVCSMPAEVMLGTGFCPERVRRSLRRRLAGLGWSLGRIAAAFSEVSEAVVSAVR